MAIKNSLFAAYLFAGLVSLLGAQSAGSYLDTESDPPRFIQRLAWTGGENTSRYEIIIEKQETRWVEHRRSFTTDNFLEVSLQHGVYRFCVIPYDLLDRPGDGTDWVVIELRRALQPVLISSTQEIVKNNRDYFLILNVNGHSIDPNAEIDLRSKSGGIAGPNDIDFDDEGNVLLTFDCSYLKEGEYELYVKNPGGLDASLGGIFYTDPSPSYLVNLGIAWMPILKIHGDYPVENISIAGAAARLSAVFPVSAIFLGPELALSWYKWPDGGQILGAELGLVLGKPMANKTLALNFRVAGAFVLFTGMDEAQAYLCAITGSSFVWKPKKNFFMEIGVDYVQMFNEKFSGLIRPGVGIGVQF